MAICSNNCIYSVLCSNQGKMNQKPCLVYKGHCNDCDNAKKIMMDNGMFYMCKLGHGPHSGKFFCLTWMEGKNGNKEER